MKHTSLVVTENSLRLRVIGALSVLGQVVTIGGEEVIAAPLSELALHVDATLRAVKTCLTKTKNSLAFDCGYEQPGQGLARGFMSIVDARHVLGLEADASLEPRPRLPIAVSQGALSSTKAFVAEVLAAEVLSRRHPAYRTVLTGGSGRDSDAEANKEMVNAKHLTPMTPSEIAEACRLYPEFTGEWKVTRFNHEYFPDEVDLTLVRGIGTPRLEWEGTELVIRVETVDARVTSVSPAYLNSYLNPGCGARVAYLPDEVLEGDVTPRVS